MRNIYYVFGIIFIVLLGSFLFWQEREKPEPLPPPAVQGNNTSPSASPRETTSPGNSQVQIPKSPAKDQGRLVIGITDVTAPIESVSEVRLTISEMSIRNASGQWTRVAANPQTFDLLTLDKKAMIALFSDSNNVAAGTYNRVTITMGGVQVIKDGKAYPAKLPSNTFSVDVKIVVINGKDSAMTLDFEASKALHLTEKSAYIFAPVVRLQTRSQASVQVLANAVHTNEGSIDTDTTIGMNEHGVIKAGFSFGGSTRFDLAGNTVFVIPPASNNSVDVKFREGTVINNPLTLLPQTQRDLVLSIVPIFTLSAEQLEKLGAGGLSLWFRVTLKPNVSTRDFLENLKKLSIVDIAELSPQPSPLP
ncbi:MAG: DUF4382 domain-containing protein [Candidatus Sungbacteria bacterium]|nr:DUF4382 domain-containing protein [Candidatus Sungbacteria bacterium]